MTPEAENKYSDEWFVALYLRYGSVEEVVRSHPGNLPISIANYHRLVNKFGLVKSAGRHVSLPETLHFFREKAMDPSLPIERIYQSMPPSFQTSLSTIHRIYQSIESQVVRRYAAALVISSADNPNEILMGKEVYANSRYGKKIGDYSIPMSFAKKDDSDFDSALRVIQQEVFSGLAVKKCLTPASALARQIVPIDISPFALYDIVDVRVRMYHLVFPSQIGMDELFSYKLTEHAMVERGEIPQAMLREGVAEMVDIYGDSIYAGNAYVPPNHFLSSINSLVLAKA